MRTFRGLLPAACAALLISCTQQPAQENGSAAGEQNAAADAAVPPVTEPPLDREQLLIAAMRAASAAAAGQAEADQRALDGKRFALAIRFGCGALPSAGSPGWTLDSKGETLRVSAAPDVSADDPLVAKVLKSDGFEAAEGFWIPRPWMLADACPRVEQAPADVDPRLEAQDKAGARPKADAEPVSEGGAEPAPVPPAIQRIAIARLFSETDARTGRQSGRGYEAVVHLEEGEAAPRDGLNLVLAGRLKALPDGRVIACDAAHPDRPPDCLISVDIDQVRLERPGSGAVLAEWVR